MFARACFVVSRPAECSPSGMRVCGFQQRVAGFEQAQTLRQMRIGFVCARWLQHQGLRPGALCQRFGIDAIHVMRASNGALC